MHRQRWIIVLAATSMVWCLPLFAGQEPPSPPESKPAAPESSSTHKTKHSHANDLLIRGTVFNDRALSLQGVKLSIRRAGEKKDRWETYTNSRGEFAIRVPQGSDYEIVAKTKGFAKQSRAINAKDGISDENFVFRLEPATGGKQ